MRLRRFWSFPRMYAAHRHSDDHRSEIVASVVCGCFHCLSTFPPDRITEWTDAPDPDVLDHVGTAVGQTALCPDCGIDAVIGDRSGYPVTHSFLAQMQQFWFHA